MEILHLERGGRASLSPGTAAGSQRELLQWAASGGILHVVDNDDQLLTSSDAAVRLRRDRLQAGRLSGFSEGVQNRDDTHFRRDPLGFMFPGCTYVLSLQPGQPCTIGVGHEYRVVVDEDGTVIDTENGGIIARWYFPGTPPLAVAGDTSWPSGDEVLLLFERRHHQVRADITLTPRRPYDHRQ